MNNYNSNLSEIDHILDEVRANLKAIKSAVDDKDFDVYQAETEKAIEQAEQIEAERSELKAKMEKDIADLEKQIQDKTFEKADLEKQYKSIMDKIVKINK